MPSPLAQRSGPSRATIAASGGTLTSPIAHPQLPGDRVVCRTLRSATNALRTA